MTAEPGAETFLQLAMLALLAVSRDSTASRDGLDTLLMDLQSYFNEGATELDQMVHTHPGQDPAMTVAMPSWSGALLELERNTPGAVKAGLLGSLRRHETGDHAFDQLELLLKSGAY
jgi:hypothetical protein